MVVQMYGCTDLWFYRCMVVSIYSCTDVSLYRCIAVHMMVVQMYACKYVLLKRCIFITPFHGCTADWLQSQVVAVLYGSRDV